MRELGIAVHHPRIANNVEEKVGQGQIRYLLLHYIALMFVIDFFHLFSFVNLLYPVSCLLLVGKYNHNLI